MADETTRDFRQRSLGCVGISMMAHVGLLTLLALAPQSEALQPLGTPEGTAPGALTVDLATPATGTDAPSAETAAPEAKAADVAANAPSEVLLASNDDANAVPLPSKDVERVEPKKLAAPVVKQTAKPKAVVAAKIAAPKAKAAPADGDVEIEKAIAAARAEDTQKSAEKEETTTTSEPQEPSSEPVEQDEEEIETAKSEEREEQPLVAAAMIAEEPEQELPSKTEAAPVAQAQEEAPKAQPQIAAAAIAPQTPAAQQAPAAAAITAPQATAPANAMPAAISQQGSGGTTAQSGVAANQPGLAAPGQSVRAGGLGYAVPMGVRIRDASELVARPGNPSPIYPQQDRLLGRQGLAVVVGRVANDGSVISVQLERSSGSATMDQEAMKTFSKWKFMPGQQGLVRKPFQFVLTGAAKELPARLRR